MHSLFMRGRGQSAPTALTEWYNNPGEVGSFWKQPFQNTANWITSGTLVTALRNGSFSTPTAFVNTPGNYATPFYRGKATDPIVEVTNGSHSINVHIPLGAIVEQPGDFTIGGLDETQPYLVWSISNATINTGSVASSGSVITGTYGMCVMDGSGLMMVDAVTGNAGNANSFGHITSYELSQFAANPNYFPQHMLAFSADPTYQISSAGPIWPLSVIDTSFPNEGPIPQGVTIGIPASTPMPSGFTAAEAFWFNCLQQFGAFFYNVATAGCVVFTIYDDTLGGYSAQQSQLAAAASASMPYVCILNYANDVSGAQYSLATTKGAVAGSYNAFPAPANLDLSPTGGVNVAPSTFGAWYPSGYNVTPSNPTTGGGGGVTEAMPGTAITGIGVPLYASPTPGTAGTGNTITITSGGQVAVNGVTFTGTSGVIELYYIDHSAFQYNGTSWYGPITTTSSGPNPLTSPAPTVLISNTSVATSQPSGTVVGTISVTTGLPGGTIGTGAYIWTYSLTGTNASDFQVVSGNLETAVANLATGSYAVTINASNSGVTGSPFSLPVTVTVTSASTGSFTVNTGSNKNGAIYDPTGHLYIAKGCNVYSDTSDVNGFISDWQLGLFPGLNHVRINVFPANGVGNAGTANAVYPTPSSWLSQVETLTGYTYNGTTWSPSSPTGIVVEFEDHNQGSSYQSLDLYTGEALTIQLNWYTAMAQYYNGNPYVWFGGPNEIGTPNFSQAGMATVSTWEQYIYNAVRPYNPTIIQFMTGAGGSDISTVGLGSGMDPSVYSTMTGITWEIHCYYDDNSSISQNGYTAASTASQYVVGATASTPLSNAFGGGGGFGIIGAQTITSADGTVPVIIGEWSSASGLTNGTGQSQITAEIITVQSSYNVGATAWAWYSEGPDGSQYDMTNQSTNPHTLTGWGHNAVSTF